jgi:hypothetical protein
MSKGVTKKTTTRFIFNLITKKAFPDSEALPDLVIAAMGEAYPRVPAKLERRLEASSSFRAVFLAAVSHLSFPAALNISMIV